MSAIRRNLTVSSLGVAAIAAVAVFPASVSAAAEQAFVAAPAQVPQVAATAPALPYELEAIAPANDAVAVPAAAPAPVDNEAQRCIAKIVHHEARNQPRAGMIAVAQTLINRVKAGGRFGDSVCAVARQPGQYFDIHAYKPREDSEDWRTAMEVAQSTLDGSAGPVAPGALYFRAAYRPATAFFRTRQRIAAVGDQVFYR